MGVTARAKLLLFGEHAAVYGHPAVGLALPWTLTVDHAPGRLWTTPGLGALAGPVLALVERLEALARDEGLAPPVRGQLRFQTTIPLSAGFGSSGSLCAALVTTFWPQLPLGTRDRLAWRAEGLFHGTPSGIDTALALRDGWWALDPSTKPVTARALPDPGLYLVTGAVVREGHTKGLVAGLAERRQTDPRVGALVDDLGAISARAIEALDGRRAEALPGLIGRARHALAALGLESNDLTQVLDSGSRQPGSLGGKLSGAGGGGAFFVAFSDPWSAKAALGPLRAALPSHRWVKAPTVVGPGQPLA